MLGRDPTTRIAFPPVSRTPMSKSSHNDQPGNTWLHSGHVMQLIMWQCHGNHCYQLGYSHTHNQRRMFYFSRCAALLRALCRRGLQLTVLPTIGDSVRLDEAAGAVAAGGGAGFGSPAAREEELDLPFSRGCWVRPVNSVPGLICRERISPVTNSLGRFPQTSASVRCVPLNSRRKPSKDQSQTSPPLTYQPPPATPTQVSPKANDMAFVANI